jgi:hypothetical protein
MTAFLNIVLLVIGTMATLAAFGGETCREGSEPILERITARGWISLMCLVLALAIGTIKEIRTEREDAISEATEAREKAEAGRKQAEQSLQLAESNSRLTLANKSLEDLRKIDQITQDRLSDTKTTLDEVRNNLSSTREDLTQQSAANQVTSLADAGQDVKEMMILLPLTAKARASTKFREAFLPSFDIDACRDLTGIEFEFSTDASHSERIAHGADDEANEQDDFADPIQKADFLVGSSNPVQGVTDAIKSANQSAGQRSSNGYIYTALINTQNHSISAARLYAALTKPGAAPFSISVLWPTIFRTRQAYQNALKSYPDILQNPSGAPLPDKNIALDIAHQHPYPAGCSNQVQRYFRMAFDKAILTLILEQKQNEVLTFKLQALPPRLIDNRWYVLFQVAGSPQLTAVDDSYLKNLDIWPAEPKPAAAAK